MLPALRVCALFALTPVGVVSPLAAQDPASVVFFHPDGMGVNTWAAVRVATVGPDGRLNWDRLPHSAVYLGHMKDALAATSHGGATVHAYGVKVAYDSYGLDGGAPLRSRSGASMSILMEAMAAGRAVGIVNSGTITEPGTGVFVARVRNRYDHAEIVRQILEAAPPVILGGGERYFLPRGAAGRHGQGTRDDGVDMVARARATGYTVVYTREELLALPDSVERVLGLFAANHTFNDRSEERLRERGLPFYAATAPTVGEMTAAALRVLGRHPAGFMLVVEEEGTDNFANANNAAGEIEAGSRADAAIGVLLDYIEAHPRTLMLMTSDSDAGGLQVLGESSADWLRAGRVLPERDANGAPVDGRDGTASLPFEAPPDRAGARWPFAIAWTSYHDGLGGILMRAAGLGAEQVHGTMDNTDAYRVMYAVLFGRDLP
ncbi:MAG TPA: alkaline phosphatase [Gemmatimonadales bacterium]|jgi:alkaline phosphatase